MKDRTRESLFNLVGGRLDGFVAFDLFAGSGVLAIESISRGATRAIAIELDRHAHRDIETIAEILCPNTMKVKLGDAFFYSQSIPDWTVEYQNAPWVVFVCPPYRLWTERSIDLKKLIDAWCQFAPPQSLVVIEFDEPAPIELLPSNWSWDLRLYRPAVLAIGDRAQVDQAAQN